MGVLVIVLCCSVLAFWCSSECAVNNGVKQGKVSPSFNSSSADPHAFKLAFTAPSRELDGANKNKRDSPSRQSMPPSFRGPSGSRSKYSGSGELEIEKTLTVKGRHSEEGSEIRGGNGGDNWDDKDWNERNRGPPFKGGEDRWSGDDRRGNDDERRRFDDDRRRYGEDRGRFDGDRNLNRHDESKKRDESFYRDETYSRRQDERRSSSDWGRSDRNLGRPGRPTDPCRGRFIHRIIVRNKVNCSPTPCIPPMPPGSFQPSVNQTPAASLMLPSRSPYYYY